MKTMPEINITHEIFECNGFYPTAKKELCFFGSSADGETLDTISNSPEDSLPLMEGINIDRWKCRYYLSDIEGISNILSLNIKAIYKVVIPQTADWAYTENAHRDGVSNFYFDRGIVTDQVSILDCYKLSNIDDVQRFLNQGAAEVYGLFNTEILDVMLTWSLHHNYRDIAKLICSLSDKKEHLLRLSIQRDDEDVAIDTLAQWQEEQQYWFSDSAIYACLKQSWPRFKLQFYTAYIEQLSDEESCPKDMEVIDFLQYADTEYATKIMSCLTTDFICQVLSTQLRKKAQLHLLQELTGRALSRPQLITLVDSFRRRQALSDVMPFIDARKDLINENIAHLSSWAKATDETYLTQLFSYKEKRVETADSAKTLSERLLNHCKVGDYDLAISCVDMGADINYKSGKPLLAACENQFQGIALMLLEKGAQPNLWCSFAIKYANKYRMAKLKAVLLKKGRNE